MYNALLPLIQLCSWAIKAHFCMLLQLQSGTQVMQPYSDVTPNPFIHDDGLFDIPCPLRMRNVMENFLGRPSGKYHICWDAWMQVHRQTALCFPCTNWGSDMGWFSLPICNKETASILPMRLQAVLCLSTLCSKASQSMFQSHSVWREERDSAQTCDIVFLTVTTEHRFVRTYECNSYE